MIIRGKDVPTLWDDGTEGSIYKSIQEFYKDEIIETSITIDRIFRGRYDKRSV